jgi:pSer/pThr/pTyr-binding forkhead associated (FHA) protein
MSGRLLGRSGALAGGDFPIAETMRIGSGADVELHVNAPGVLPLHATISRDGDRVLLTAEPAAAAGSTFLNGRRVTSERLQHLDVITIGRDVDLIYLAT